MCPAHTLLVSFVSPMSLVTIIVVTSSSLPSSYSSFPFPFSVLFLVLFPVRSLYAHPTCKPTMQAERA